MKKALCILLAAMLLIATAAGCGTTVTVDTDTKAEAEAETEAAEEAVEEAAEEEAADGESVELQLYFATSNPYDDVAAVCDALNAYIEPKIGATVNINFINSGSYPDQVALMARSGEPFDICVFTEVNLRSLVAQDAVTPLNDLIAEYGDGIIDAVGEEFMKAAYINGELYCIPSLKDMAMSRMMVFDKAIAEEAGVLEELENCHSIFDLTPIFEKVSEVTDIYMFGGAPNAQTFSGWNWDNLSDSLGVLMDYGAEPKVVNVFETDYYRQLCETMREWYNNGWIDKDLAYGTDFWSPNLKNRVAFSGFTSYKPGNVQTCSNGVGYELGYCILTDAIRCTSNVMNATLSIPASSEHPVEAMKFIQLMYTDPFVENTLINGVENVHFVYNEDGSIKDACESIDDRTYYQFASGWYLGNQFITPVWDGQATDTWEQTREWNQNSTTSAAFGFAWNNSDYVNEVTACTNVLTKYRAELETGTIDPENIDKFNEELYANGLQTIIDAKQAQLDEWLANQ